MIAKVALLLVLIMISLPGNETGVEAQILRERFRYHPDCPYYPSFVCGKDERTYMNECSLRAYDVQFEHQGSCRI
ncbi:ovomucoid-like [Antennarius striatus]|uniref:ovomucoid-like n=1 Tax=Antennarius striatus TaxID=241820 RepID=UPI0035B0E432